MGNQFIDPRERNKLIGERVRFYREARELSLAALASALQNPISGQSLAKYETGVSRWPAELLIDIAVTLGLDIRLLTGLEDGKHEGKDTDQWEAEKYKNRMLSLTQQARKVVYKIIDEIRGL